MFRQPRERALLPAIIVFHGHGQDIRELEERWGINPPNPVPALVENNLLIFAETDFNGAGVVIQAYGRTAELPEPNAMPAAGVSAIHFYASKAESLELFFLDSQEVEQQDTSFQPSSRAFQSHNVRGSGRRVARIAGIQQNDPGFWLLNCPNLFALHPSELLRPQDA